MEILTILKESFSELFSSARSIFIKKKGIFIKIIAFVFLLMGLIFLSNTLTSISFLDSIDLADPNNVAELQPLVDLDQRSHAIIALILLFGFVSTFIGRRQGFGAFLSLILSGYTIYQIIVPLILIGWNPIVVTITFGTVILIISVLLSHGINAKTITSLTAGVATLLLTLGLAEIFRIWMQVSGYYGDYTYNLLVTAQANFNMPAIVLSSIILSGLGLLDDITLTQTSVTVELFLANKKLTLNELYNKAMNVGRDHVGALVNSLFYAYAAASLPLLLLMNFAQITVEGVIDQELFVEEILRTLVASTGLILAVPLSTFIAAYVIKNKIIKVNESDIGEHSHVH